MGLTDEKIEAAISGIWPELEQFYDRLFPDGCPKRAELWIDLAKLDLQTEESLKKRPLTLMEIRGIVGRYKKRFKELCLAQKPRGNAPGGRSKAS